MSEPDSGSADLPEPEQKLRPWEIGLVIAVYAALHNSYFRYARLEEAAYLEPFLFWEALTQLKPFAALALPAAVLACFAPRLRWSAFPDALPVRVFIGITVGIVAWAFAFTEINIYYDQVHLADRLLLIGAAVGVVIHPVFVPLFLAVCLVLTHQFTYPLGSHAYTFTDKQVFFDLLVLFTCVLGLRVVRHIPPPHHILGSRPGNVWEGQERLAVLRIRRTTTHFDGSQIRVLRDELVHEISLP